MSVTDAPPSISRAQVPHVRVHWTLYVCIGLLTGAVLMYAVVEQLFDTNFLFLWEATALLAGDRPYRDFYEMGWPLMTMMSAAMQWAVGYRLIGEFLIQWTFIVAGVLVGFHLAIRLSHSLWASLTTTLMAIAIIAATPTYHFPKLFFYPVAVWVAWWYMAAPSVRRAAIVGLVTAIAFLYRHDHGLYIGIGAVLAFVLARVINPASRGWRSSAWEVAAFTIAAALPLLPWVILVQSTEGLGDYVRTRLEWGRAFAPDRSPYLALRDFNPMSVVGHGGLPTRETAEHWLMQLTLLLPVAVIAITTLDLVRGFRRGTRLSREHAETLLAAAMVVVVGIRLFREDGYFVVVLPLAAAFGAQVLAGPGETAGRAWRIGQRTVALIMLVVTTVAVVGHLNAWDLLNRSEFSELAPTYHRLFTTPPIDGLLPADRARQIQQIDWLTSDADTRQTIGIRYLHDCTREGDRIFVTGSTPYQVDYYAQRSIAGGHVEWRHGWRSDPAHARQLLQLLRSQSVPFAFSTDGPVLADLEKYPDLRDYFQLNYVEVEGGHGQLLVDRRRQPTGRFGALDLPCFR